MMHLHLYINHKLRRTVKAGENWQAQAIALRRSFQEEIDSSLSWWIELRIRSNA